MDMCIEKAHQYGMGMVAVRNSSHYGIAGYWASMAVKEDMIGITDSESVEDSLSYVRKRGYLPVFMYKQSLSKS